MRVSSHSVPEQLHDSDVQKSILRDISGALQAVSTGTAHSGLPELVINPTVWCRLQGGSRMTRVVMNQAGFFSDTFQQALVGTGRWKKEVEIEGQTIDAYGEFGCHGGSSISLGALSDWLPKSGIPSEEVPAVFSRLHGAFVQRSIFSKDGLPPLLRSIATGRTDEGVVRVGVEFETGNIASSFRALMKLGLLFRLNKIDVGVFITSKSKSEGAARIWPVSNRNGSFEELEQRRWKDIVDFPVHAIGFAPDRFDDSAPFVQSKGLHMHLSRSGSTVTVGGKVYFESLFAAGSDPLYSLS